MFRSKTMHTHSDNGSNSQAIKRNTVNFNTKDATLRSGKGENPNQQISEVKTKWRKESREIIII